VCQGGSGALATLDTCKSCPKTSRAYAHPPPHRCGSILIVEYANQLRAHGLSITDAVAEASKIRLRPILTAGSFYLAVTG